MAIPDRDDEAADAMERRANWLGHAGLIPFVVLSLWLYAIAEDHPWHSITIALLVAYASVTLSFLGGIRWGFAMRGRLANGRNLALSIIPALFAWAAPFALQPYCFAVLAVAYAAQGAWDSLSVGEDGLPEWFGRLRIRLTIVVVLTMILAFAATA